MKEEFWHNLGKVVEGLPSNFQKFALLVKSMEFDQEPPYDELIDGISELVVGKIQNKYVKQFTSDLNKITSEVWGQAKKVGSVTNSVVSRIPKGKAITGSIEKASSFVGGGLSKVGGFGKSLFRSKN